MRLLKSEKGAANAELALVFKGIFLFSMMTFVVIGEQTNSWFDEVSFFMGGGTRESIEINPNAGPGYSQSNGRQDCVAYCSEGNVAERRPGGDDGSGDGDRNSDWNNLNNLINIRG